MTKKNNRVATYWNMRGGTYAKSWQSVAKKRLSDMEIKLVTQTIDSLKKIQRKEKYIKTLDIGIAIGRISNAITKYKVNHYGTDISQTMITYCQRIFAKNRKIKEFKLHDIHNPLPKKWGKFDIVTAYRVLAYTPRLQKKLTNIYNALNVGGTLIFTYPNKYSSTIFPKLLYSNNRLGSEITYGELRRIIEKTGFKEYHIIGFSRLLDTFYDLSNSNFSAAFLFAIEKFLSRIFGPTLFVRLFYVTCKK